MESKDTKKTSNKKLKIGAIVICLALFTLFIMPIPVRAESGGYTVQTLYSLLAGSMKMQKSAVNDFKPTEINIAVHENGDDTDNPDKDTELIWDETSEPGIMTVPKSIKIKNLSEDGKNNPDAFIRVTFVPYWVLKVEREFADGTKEVFETVIDNGDNMEKLTDLNLAEKDTEFTLGNVTYKLNPNWSDNWIYNKKDGYFYYINAVAPGEETEELLQKVSLSSDEYEELYRDCDLRIDVVADAIQTEGEAVEKRWTNSGITVKDNRLEISKE